MFLGNINELEAMYIINICADNGLYEFLYGAGTVAVHLKIYRKQLR